MSILQDQASLKFRSLKNTHLWHLLFLLSATVVIIFFFVGKCLGPTFPESFVWPKDPDSLMSLGEKPTSVRHKEEIEILKKSKSRMYIKQTTEDLVLFFNDHMVKLRNIAKNPGKDKFKEFEQIINYGIEHAEGYKRIIVKEFEELAQQDGSYTLQKKEKKLLEDIVQERLYHLQNPKNCSDAPVLLCDLTNPYGFASGIHDVLWCFIKAYHSKQMLVLVTTKWHYTKTNWEETFQPLSEKCSLDDVNLKNAPRGPGKNSPTVRGLLTKLPSDITPRLVRIHDNPMAWWYGQFMYYLMRPNQHLNSFLDRKSKNISFDTSVAGIHVRRTDKIRSEAKSHAVEEYMNYVEDHFRSLELKSKEVKRKVFVATDEPAVIRELKQKFPSYTFIYNPSNANLASNFSTRYSNDSFWGILADVFMLAKSDILVCTLSSGLCRVAYELMQVLRDDLPRVHSLDVEYHYAYVRPPLRRAVYDHNQLSEKETSFKKGDILVPDHRLGLSDAVHGKTNNGFLIRTNKRTNKGGQIPAYKTEPIYELEDFPSF